MALNDTWGTKKQNFYGRNKDSDEDSDTDDDQDEQEQALRLQQIKALKMSRFMQQQQQKVSQPPLAQKPDSDQELGSDSGESEDSEEGERKMGDKLF